MEEYSVEICKVSEEILANLSVLMELKEDSIKELHKVMKLGMRMNYYPFCSKPDLVLGLSPHSDGNSITILLQDDDVTGLQVHHQGEWVAVKPLAGAFVVNIGDTMEVPKNAEGIEIICSLKFNPQHDILCELNDKIKLVCHAGLE